METWVLVSDACSSQLCTEPQLSSWIRLERLLSAECIGNRKPKLILPLSSHPKATPHTHRDILILTQVSVKTQFYFILIQYDNLQHCLALHWLYSGLSFFVCLRQKKQKKPHICKKTSSFDECLKLHCLISLSGCQTKTLVS